MYVTSSSSLDHLVISQYYIKTPNLVNLNTNVTYALYTKLNSQYSFHIYMKQTPH